MVGVTGLTEKLLTLETMDSDFVLWLLTSVTLGFSWRVNLRIKEGEILFMLQEMMVINYLTSSLKMKTSCLGTARVFIAVNTTNERVNRICTEYDSDLK